MRGGYAQRVDSNQKQIVRELRQIAGISVEVIGHPVDLLVGHRNKTYLFEVKTTERINRKSALTTKQQEFIPNWRGHIAVISSTDDILNEIKSK